MFTEFHIVSKGETFFVFFIFLFSILFIFSRYNWMCKRIMACRYYLLLSLFFLTKKVYIYQRFSFFIYIFILNFYFYFYLVIIIYRSEYVLPAFISKWHFSHYFTLNLIPTPNSEPWTKAYTWWPTKIILQTQVSSSDSV